MKENEMGETHSRCGAHEECLRNLVEKPEMGGGNCLEYLGANWKAIVKCILRNYGLRVLTGLVWLRTKTICNHFEYNN